MFKRKEQGGYNSNEKKEERTGPPRRLLPPPPRVPKENITVTIDSEIPPMPEKHQILPKPNWEGNYKKDYDVYRAQVNKLKEEKVR